MGPSNVGPIDRPNIPRGNFLDKFLCRRFGHKEKWHNLTSWIKMCYCKRCGEIIVDSVVFSENQ